MKYYPSPEDGDAMSIQMIPDEYRDYVMTRISPSASIFMEKNLAPLYTPSHEFLYGLYLASRVTQTGKPVRYRTGEDLDKMYENGDIDADTELEHKPGTPVTYGRIRLSNIIGANIDTVLAPNEPITASNIVLIMGKINLQKDRLERIKRLQDFSFEQMRLVGITALSLKDLYVSLRPEFKESIDRTLDDDKLSHSQKLIKVQEIYKSYLDNDFKKEVSSKVMNMTKSSDRIKIDQLVNITLPNMVIQSDGSVKVSDSSIFSGMTPDDYVSHAVSNRHILQIKANVTPMSGYVTRQLTYIAQMFRFREVDQPSKDYIEVPRKLMIGRVTINGNYIGAQYKKDDTLDKFPSCIFNKEPVIYQNQVRTPKKGEVVEGFEFYEGDNIGLSFGTSITESITQGGLALKHGGALRSVVDDYKLIAPYDGKVTEVTDYTITLNGKDTYYKTKQFSIINYEFKKGETVGYVNVVFTPAYRADSMSMFLDSFSNQAKKNEKNELHKSVSLAPKSGKIHYKVNEKADKIEVFIDSELIVSIPLDNFTLLSFPDGAMVNRLDRFSTDVLDMGAFEGSVKERYEAFNKEFKHIYKSNMTEDLIEFLFRLLFDVNQTGYLGVKGAMKKIPIMSQISFGYATNHLKTIDDTELELEGTDAYDLFTNLILGITNNKIP